MATLEEMVAKGTRKLASKGPVMAEKYNAAKGQMKEEYGRLPFGPITKRAYGAGVDAGVYRAPDPERWGRRFVSGVSK